MEAKALTVAVILVIAMLRVDLALSVETQKIEVGLTKDAYIYEGAPTSNYGTEDNFQVQSRATNLNTRAFLGFDLSTVTMSCTVINVTLKIYRYAGSADGRTYEVHMVNESWTETGVTWNNQPTVSTEYVTETVPEDPAWMNINVTDLASLGEEFSFRIKDASEDSETDYDSYFYSKEYSDPDYQPLIEVWVEYEAMYTFDGEYYETGLFSDTVCIDIHYENFSQDNFDVNGLTPIYFGENPLFFSWSVDSYIRMYYPLDNDTFTIFTAETPFYVYSFMLRDYPGVLKYNAHMESYRVINNTQYLIERRKVADNIGNTVPFIMEQGASYLLVLNTSVCEYRFGYFLAAGTLEKDLPLPFIDFPSNIKLGYKIWVDATRSADMTEITVNYQDPFEDTSLVELYITYRNNSVVYYDSSTADTVQFQWDSADPQTDYIAYVMAEHGDLGSLSWKRFVEHLRDYESPWGGLSYLGNWPIDPRYVISVFIILAIAGTASRLTVEAGLFSAVMVAGMLIYFGWLSLTGNKQNDYYLLTIILGWVILYAVGEARRRSR